MESRDKNNNKQFNNFNKNQGREGQRDDKPNQRKFNTNYSKTDKGRKDFKQYDQSSTSGSMFKKQHSKDGTRVSNTQNRKNSQSNQFRNSSFNGSGYPSKDDDVNIDLSHRSKPRNWKEKQRKQKQESELEIMDMNLDKFQKQQEWEQKRNKGKNKNKAKGNKGRSKFSEDYDYEFDDYGYDDWS